LKIIGHENPGDNFESPCIVSETGHMLSCYTYPFASLKQVNNSFSLSWCR
jgi:hypothetical protein